MSIWLFIYKKIFNDTLSSSKLLKAKGQQSVLVDSDYIYFFIFCLRTVVLEVDPGGGAFALFLRRRPGAFRQLKCPYPGEFAHFFKKLPGCWPRWAGWGLLNSTDVLPLEALLSSL